MDFMAWANVLMAAVGVAMMVMGVWVLAARRVPRWLAPPDEPGRIGRYLLCFSLFWLLQVAGFAGVRLGLFDGLGRGMFMLLGFAAGIFALARYRPRGRRVTTHAE